MKFGVYGGFEIKRKPNRHGIFDGSFWSEVRGENGDLPNACGCYIFALQNGANIVAWYVGKTERRTFYRECFAPAKINYYNEILVDRNGTPLMFLIPRLTAAGRFCRPTIFRYRDVDFLETMLIGMALERNEDLANVKKTQLLQEINVPGVINNRQGHPSQPVRDLRNALGLSR
jgi:hypothetical protein